MLENCVLKLLRIGSSLAGAALASVAVAASASLGACSSTTERATFVEDAAVTPASPPEKNATPIDEPQVEPVPTGSDAGLAPDAPDTCKRAAPSNKCGLTPQCGCTAAETCDVADTGGNVACVAAGKGAMGVSCIGTEGCAQGLTCVFDTCHAFCPSAGTTSCTAPKTGACVQVKGQGGVVLPNLTVCRVTCDLRDANACGGATAAGTAACVLADGATDCAKAGTKALNQTCTPTEDCLPGLVCAVTGGATNGICKKWCRVGTNDCGGATACNGFGTKVIVSGVEHGVCP